MVTQPNGRRQQSQKLYSVGSSPTVTTTYQGNYLFVLYEQNPWYSYKADVAQLAERLPSKQAVVGSTPTIRSDKFGRCSLWPSVKRLHNNKQGGYARGSTPSLTTIKQTSVFGYPIGMRQIPEQGTKRRTLVKSSGNYFLTLTKTNVRCSMSVVV